MRNCDNDILDWFRLSFMGKNRRFQFEQSSDITFHVSSVKRKLVIKLSSSMASDVSSGSHVSMTTYWALTLDSGFQNLY